MKTKSQKINKRPKASTAKEISIKYFFFISLFIGCAYLSAQVLPGPKVDWKREDWSNLDWSGLPQSQDNSGDDWWYTHTKLYDQGVHVGYIGVGYGTWDDASVILNSQNFCYEYTGALKTSYDCHDFETSTDQRGMFNQVAARYDLDGNMVWCKRYNEGSFFNVYQDSQENILLIGETKYAKSTSGAAIGYNPTSTNPSGTTISCTATSDFNKKLNIIKIDLDGLISWNFNYGITDATATNWKTEVSVGNSIIEYDGGYRAIGSTNDNQSGGIGLGLMLQLDLNGVLSGTPGKQTYTFSHPTRPHNYRNVSFRDIKVSSNGHIAVTGVALDHQAGANIDQDALIVHFDGTNPVNSFTVADTVKIDAWTSKLVSPPAPHGDLAKTLFLEYISAIDAFAVPVFSGDLAAGGNSGDAEVEIRFYASDFNPQAQLPSTITAGDYIAFDLQMGIVEVSGGFATVSSKQPGPAPAFNANIDALVAQRFPGHDPVANPNGETCPLLDPNNASRSNNAIRYWNTDASVAKYKITTVPLAVNKVWERTFDFDNKPREAYPGDIKQQECLYSIVEDDVSGALSIAGNTSSNIDDSYIAKLFHDDCIALSYDEKDLSDHIIDINSNTTWNTNKTVLGEVRIKSGNTLTISGANTTISMSDEKLTGTLSFITVEKGAKLIVDAATITRDSRCLNSTWNGIRILGDNSLSQNPPSNQGVLELRNGALIDHAMYAISFGEGTWTDFGGIVDAKDATFRVYRRGVELMSYPFTNTSTFERCTFEYVNSITESPLPLITAWDNRGVRFIGCSFADNSGLNEYSEYSANGIFSIDAAYEVLPGCSTSTVPCPANEIIRSSFSKLNQGIYATGSAGTQSVGVEATDFIDNAIAMRIEGLDHVRFVNNKIENGGLVKNGYRFSEPLYTHQIGFFANKAKGFEIEQNEFEQTGTAEPTLGVHIKDAGTQANEVFWNTFKGNDLGQRFVGINRNPRIGSIEGLQFLCNSNPVSNVVDVEIRDNGPFSIGRVKHGIKDNQGSASPATSAANTFSTASITDIDNQSFVNLNYHYKAIQQKPTPNLGLVNTINVNSFNFCATQVNQRPGLFTQFTFPQGKIEIYYNKRKEYDDLLYTYFQNIDGGNTDSLIQAIQLSIPSQAQQLRDDLMSQSPYLSQQALMDAAGSGILTDALLLEVCLANPDATESEAFLDYVEFDIPNPLPANMVQSIYLNWGAETPRTILENQLAVLNGDLGRLSNQILHFYAIDTADYKDSIENILLSRKNLGSNYQLVEKALEEKNFALADQRMSDIQSNHALDAEQLAEHSNLLDYIAFHEELNVVGITYMQLDDSRLVDLRSIATAHRGRTASLARNILCFGYQECEDGFPVPPQGRLKSRRQFSVFNTDERNVQTESFIYPNPAKEQIQIQIENFDENKDYRLIVKDIAGRTVLERSIIGRNERINLTDLDKASYLFVLMEGDEYLHREIIIKQ